MTNSFRCLAFVCSILLFSSTCLMAVEGEDNIKDALSFGLLAKNLSVTSPSDILIAVRPLADYLESQLHRRINVRVFETYRQMHAAFARSDIDMSYCSDREYVAIKKAFPGLRPFAKPIKLAGPQLDVLMVTRKKDRIDAIAKLKGKRLACHSTLSSVSYLVPQVMLARKSLGIPEDFFGSIVKTKREANGVYAIVFRKADVVFTSNHIFDLVSELKPKIRRFVDVVNLREKGYPQLCFGPMFARAKLPRATVDVVQKALLSMRESDAKSKMILLLFRISGFVAAENADYDPLRSLMNEVEDLDEGK